MPEPRPPTQRHDFDLVGARLSALASGALWWQAERLLAVADLHLGKSLRIARLAGTLLPPYEAAQTLERLDAVIEAHDPAQVVCLGDSFDDLAAADLPEPEAVWLARLMAGRRWVWLAGNHDPGPLALGGEHRAELRLGPLTFRHIARSEAAGEISGHYHPKMRLAGRSHACFLIDGRRVILPAFGAYTGGLSSSSSELARLFPSGGLAVLTGRSALLVPLPPAARS